MPNIFTTPEERARLDNMLKKVEPTVQPSPSQVMPGRPQKAEDIFADIKVSASPEVAAALQPQPQEIPDTSAQFNAPMQQTAAPAPAVAGGQAVVPVEKTMTKTEATNIRPEDRAALTQAQAGLNAARRENLQVQTEAAKAAADAQYAYADKLNTELQLLKTEQERINALREANRERYLQKAAEYEGMKVENPWSNMSTGSKIMAAVAISLGRLGSTLQGQGGGTNTALEIINANIARDIDIQKANMDKKKGELTAIQQYGQDLRQMGMDDITIREAMIGMGKQQLASQLEALKVRIGEKDPRYPQVSALQQKYAEEALNEKMKLAELSASKVSNVAERDFVKLDSGAGKLPDSVKQQLADIETTKQKLAELERAKQKVDTGPISSGLKELGKAVGYESTVAVPFEANINDVVASYARGMEGGRMTDQDIQRYKQIMPNFMDNDKQFKAKLQGAKERLRLQEEALRQQYGLPISKESQIEKQKQGLK